MSYKVGGEVVIDDSRNITAATFTGDGTNLTNIRYFPAGTVMLFVQSTAPVGWTKSAAHDNKALRVVTGAAGSGGTQSFTAAFSNKSINVTGSTDPRVVTGSVGNTTLLTSQIPLHGHPFRLTIQSASTARSSTYGGLMMGFTGLTNYGSFTGTPGDTAGQQIGGEGGNGSHNHPFNADSHAHAISGTSTMDLTVQYVDAIIATKD